MGNEPFFTNRHCGDVVNLTWSSSITEAKTIYLFGEGLNKVELSLNEEVKEKLPVYKIKYAEGSVALKFMSGKIRSGGNGEESTCELILSRGVDELFAITNAHLP